jgi:hypothetical protein
MPKDPLVISRKKLYEQVWSEPIMHVAKRIGLSGRGFGKLCARHHIPVPPRGWWAKKQHGHRVRQAPLPPNDDRSLDTIELSTHAVADRERELTNADAPEYRREKDPAWRIEVPQELGITHPLVKAAGAAIRCVARENKQNRSVHWNERYQAQLIKPGPGYLEIAVSKSLRERALRIMQALLTAMEKRGYTVSVNAKNETIVRVLDEPMEIALIERFRQVVVKHSYGTGMDLEPSGRLRLRVGSSYSNSGVEDKPPRQIESELNHFIQGLVRRALEAKRQRAIHQERERRWRIHDDERRHKQQEQESERLRSRRLRTFGVRWARQQRLHEFVRTLEQRADETKRDPQHQALADRWVDWAKEHLRQTDAADGLLQEQWPLAQLREIAPMPWNWD